MSVIIRLRRMGRTNKPFYRVVATDSRCSNSGRFLEAVGWYDPDKPEPNFSVKLDRVDYWKDNGAVFSETVQSLVRKARKGLGVSADTPEPTPSPEAEPVSEPVAEAAVADSVASEEAPADEKPEAS